MTEGNEERELEPFVRHGTEENRVEVSADDVLNAIAEGRDIDIEWAVIEGDLDIEKIRDDLVEQDGREVIFCDVKIRYSTIKGKTCFRQAAFTGDAVFVEVTFSGTANFFRTTFNGDARFYEATFSGHAYFYEATFRRRANFIQATFRRRANFIQATFRRRANFIQATFSENVDFMEAHMERPANFRDVQFQENTVFVGLWNDVFWPIFGFILWLFLRLISLLRRRRTRLPKWPVTGFQGFNTTTIMDGSSNPYLKRYIDDEQWIASSRQRGWVQKFWFFIWELMSHCGRNIWLWAFWSLLLAVAFGAIYADYAVPSWVPDRLDHLLVAIDPDVLISPTSRAPTAFTPFYFSIVTFTTLGFGDVTPLNLAGEIWLALEVVAGYIMLGGLISIFANKLARRA